MAASWSTHRVVGRCRHRGLWVALTSATATALMAAKKRLEVSSTRAARRGPFSASRRALARPCSGEL